MKVTEKCSCGASIEFDSSAITTAEKTLAKWRREHLHHMRPHPYIGGYATRSAGYGGAVASNDANGTPEIAYKIRTLR